MLPSTLLTANCRFFFCIFVPGMAPLTHAARPTATALSTAARRLPRCNAAAALSTTAPARSDSEGSFSSPFKSPFRGETKGSSIPDFSHYMSKNSGNTNLLFQYFMVGSMGAITAAGAKSTVQGRFTGVWGVN